MAFWKRTTALLSGKCPNCEEGPVFKDRGSVFLLRSPKMNDVCPNCGEVHEKEPGYFLGAMYFSYALVVMGGFVVFMGSWALYPGQYNFWAIPLFIGLCVLLSMPNYRVSRLLWMYILTRKGSKEA